MKCKMKEKFENEKDIYDIKDMIPISWNISSIWHPVSTDKIENWIFLPRNVDIDIKSLFCVKSSNGVYSKCLLSSIKISHTDNLV